METITDFDYIVRFFLNVFRIQLGAAETESSKPHYKLLPSLGTDKERIYELYVPHEGRTKTRRMTVSRLGETVESKSTCYMVVFGDIMVVKIPPNPVKEFKQYLQSMEVELKISQRLEPEIPCVSPNVSAILKKIPIISYDPEKSPSDQEKDYLDQLARNPQLQNYLKIGGTFILFMNLSKHAFLNQIIDKLHQEQDEIKHEIQQGVHLLDDLYGFETSYGQGHDELFFEMNNLFNLFDKELSSLPAAPGNGGQTCQVPGYQKKQWFSDALTGTLMDDADEIPKEALVELKKLLTRLFETHEQTITRFHHLVTSSAKARLFHKRKSIASGMITNFIKLLYHLWNKGVSIRDLKPDNMFIVGNSDNPEIYLTSPDNYALGLIDFETATVLKPASQIQQPLLAGTPSFATPSHVFENSILTQIFPDLPRILYLQDWYAGLGIIFQIVTNETLFSQTGRLIPEIVRMKIKTASQGASLEDLFHHVSWIFWTSATKEFNSKIQTYRNHLESIQINLNQAAMKMLNHEMTKEKEILSRLLRNMVHGQTFFKNPKTRQGLLTSGTPALIRLCQNWQQGTNVPKTSPHIQSQIVKFLNDLIVFKQEFKDQQQLFSAFKQNNGISSVLHIMILIFRFVLHAMYYPVRQDRQHPRVEYEMDSAHSHL